MFLKKNKKPDRFVYDITPEEVISTSFSLSASFHVTNDDCPKGVKPFSVHKRVDVTTAFNDLTQEEQTKYLVEAMIGHAIKFSDSYNCVANFSAKWSGTRIMVSGNAYFDNGNLSSVISDAVAVLDI